MEEGARRRTPRVLAKAQGVKYVLSYRPAAGGLEKVAANIAGHRAHWAEYVANGTLVAIGPFADPREGAMGIFRTRESAESFAKSDPFVTNGVVESWQIQEWAEALLPD